MRGRALNGWRESSFWRRIRPDSGSGTAIICVATPGRRSASDIKPSSKAQRLRRAPPAESGTAKGRANSVPVTDAVLEHLTVLIDFHIAFTTDQHQAAIVL